MEATITIVVLILVGVYAYKERKNKLRMAEDDSAEVSLNLGATWLAGVLLFISGYLAGSDLNIDRSIAFVLTCVGVIVFTFACIFTLPKVKTKKDPTLK